MEYLICLAGPSGVGKSSYAQRLKEHFNLMAPTIVTTRNPREDDDISRYTYVCKNRFESLVEKDEFLEWDIFRDNFYGTLKSNLTLLNKSDYSGIVLDLTPEGCRQVKIAHDDAVIICLLPDDPTWLKKRLRKRGSNKDAEIEKRTELLDSYIQSVQELNAPVVQCGYEPETWDITFKQIIDTVINHS